MKKVFLLPLLTVFLLLLPVPSFAVTVDEIITMAEAGVSDEIILSLVEATESRFHLTAEDIVAMEDAGVSEDVILALINGTEEEKAKDTDSDSDFFLQLTDEQFRELFLDDNESSESSYRDENRGNQRTPEYYQSPGSAFDGGYFSTPDYSTSSFSSGLTSSYYSQVYPGVNYSGRKYYRPVYYYYSTPAYYIFDGYGYYPGSCRGGYYRYYPSYYGYSSYCPSRYHRHYYKSYSYPRSGYRYYGNDWYLSLGISF